MDQGFKYLYKYKSIIGKENQDNLKASRISKFKTIKNIYLTLTQEGKKILRKRKKTKKYKI